MNLNGDTNSTYMVIYEDSKTLVEIENNYEKIILILLLIVFIFLLFLNINMKRFYRIIKKEILSQQSKMIAMGEMIENIAHQWRQPLSIISTVASGVKLEKEVVF